MTRQRGGAPPPENANAALDRSGTGNLKKASKRKVHCLADLGKLLDDLHRPLEPAAPDKEAGDG